MRILAVTGSLCSGKSTLIERTITHSVQTAALGINRAAYLLNDRPASDGRMVDGHVVRDIARIIPFPNRCFTCEDTANLVRTLRSIDGDGAIDIAFVEGFGFVAGHETAEALRSTGYSFDIFSLVDARHLSENLAAYGDVIKSQVAVATIGIGITHMDGADMDAVERFVANSANPGIPVFGIAKQYGIPPRVFSRIVAADAPVLEETCDCPCCSSHDYDGRHHDHGHAGHHHSHEHEHEHEHHEHGHEHGHDHHGHGHHDFYSVTFPLRRSVRLDDLKTALGTVVFRAKGVVEGVRFDMVHGDWTCSDPSDQAPIITAYGHDDIMLPDGLVDRSMRPAPTASTKALLRSDGGIDPALTERAIEKLASAIPSEPVILPGAEGVRIAVQLEELQLLKHISQRESVKGAWFVRAVSIALTYWIACARHIAANSTAMDPSELPVSKLELGLSIGYWAHRFRDQLDAAVLNAAADSEPARLLAEGVETSTDWMYSDPKRAIEQAGYFRDVLDFAAAESQGGRAATEQYERRIFTAGISDARKRGDAVVGAWMRLQWQASVEA